MFNSWSYPESGSYRLIKINHIMLPVVRVTCGLKLRNPADREHSFWLNVNEPPREFRRPASLSDLPSAFGTSCKVRLL